MGEQAPCVVSVLIPAFNARTTLEETLRSVQRQSFTDFEAIVVDDGSKDETASIAAKFAESDHRFRLIVQKNGGVAAARNTALSAARGPWVAPLDADDLWHPDKLARQMQRARDASAATVLVYSWSVDIDESSMVIARRLDLDRFEGDAYAALVWMNFVGNASVPLVRREALVAVGGWDSSLRDRDAQGCEDWQIYLRLAERGDFALASGFLVGYRQSSSSMSRRVDEMTRSYELVLVEAQARHPELPAKLFRWSRAAYDFYRFETLRGSGATLAGLRPLSSALLGDPAWLGRRSTRKKFKAWLRSAFEDSSAGAASGDLGRALQHFEQASTEPPYEVSEGPWSDSRRKLVSEWRIARQP